MNELTNKSIFQTIEAWSPISLGYDWDNNGLQVGSYSNAPKNVLISLDVLESTVDEAIEKNIDLIIAHHPLLFKGLKTIDFSSPKGRTIKKLIENNITVYAAHTNLDVAEGGVNDLLADELNIKHRKPLVEMVHESLYKLIVYVPLDYLADLKNALFESGAGHIGNYANCSFETSGKGQFKPLKASDPFSGQHDKINYFEESKLEVIVEEEKLSDVVKHMKKAHPYEEVAYDILKLENKNKSLGIGRIGCLNEKISVQLLCEQIKENLDVKNLRVSGNLDKQVKKIAILGGSGEKFIADASKQNADVLITGDITFHQAQEAIELGLVVIDAGHYIEKIMKKSVRDYLSSRFKDDSINFVMSETNTDPFTFI